jgi:hypothetical protein
MTPHLKGLILALVVSAISLTGCGSSSVDSNSSVNANSQQIANSNTAKTNVEELGMLINVPYESDEVFWKDDPAHKKLVAVLKFPPNEAKRLTADAEKIRPAQKVSINPESWFPPELVAQSDMTGDDTLNGKSYAANAFFQDQYNEGRIIHIDDTDYFVLELTAK